MATDDRGPLPPLRAPAPVLGPGHRRWVARQRASQRRDRLPGPPAAPAARQGRDRRGLRGGAGGAVGGGGYLRRIPMAERPTTRGRRQPRLIEREDQPPIEIHVYRDTGGSIPETDLRIL